MKFPVVLNMNDSFQARAPGDPVAWIDEDKPETVVIGWYPNYPDTHAQTMTLNRRQALLLACILVHCLQEVDDE